MSPGASAGGQTDGVSVLHEPRELPGGNPARRPRAHRPRAHRPAVRDADTRPKPPLFWDRLRVTPHVNQMGVRDRHVRTRLIEADRRGLSQGAKWAGASLATACLRRTALEAASLSRVRARIDQQKLEISAVTDHRPPLHRPNLTNASSSTGNQRHR